MSSQGMELAARSIDLLKALGDTANSPDSIVRTGLELGRWLGRERLNERELQLCLQHARSLVFPNANSFHFYQAVLTNSPPKHAALFVVQTSGSLGRLMANDLNLRWLASTVAGLFQFHSEKFISDAICTFIFQARRPSKGLLSKHQLEYNDDRVKMQPVLDKIISSIWFYIVNSGTIKSGIGELLPLPKVIEEVCVKGHHLQSYDLGTVIAQLQGCEGELLIESEHLIKNLTSWLIYHFNGHIRVVLGGNVIYNKNAEENGFPKRIEVRVCNSCPRDEECTMGANTTISELHVYTIVAGNLQSLFQTEYTDSSRLFETEPRIRSKLYNTSIGYPKTTAGRDSIKNLVRCTTVHIVDWMLKLPVLKSLQQHDLTFEVDAGQTNGMSEKNTRLANILARLPSILNLGWPEYPISTFVYAEPAAGDQSDGASINSEEESSAPPQDSYTKWVKGLDNPVLKTVLEHYPILRDTLREVKKSCFCWSCRNSIPTNGIAIYPGCLQHKALIEIMQLIAHAIVDSFGCDDVSAVSRIELEDLGVLEVLGTIAEGQLRWNDWFTVAARTYLGCPPPTKIKLGKSQILNEMPQMKGLPATFTPCVIAVQYGGLAVIAPWIDMSIDMCQCKPFSMEAVAGRLGLPSEDPAQLRMQSVEGDFAVIEARDAEVLEHGLINIMNGAKMFTEAAIQRDDTAINVDVILVNSDLSRYQLWLRMSTTTRSRLVDPSCAMRAACQLGAKIKCNHATGSPSDIDTSIRGLVRTHSFNDVLGFWSDNAGPMKVPSEETPIITISPVCDTYHGLNTVLSFGSSLPLILSHETSCLSCIVDQAQKFQREEESKFLTNGFVVVVSKEIRHTDWSVHSQRARSMKSITSS
ncbi:hypothetical protein F5Y13DRAFT_205169 [Hypoxylon sp. FL1857]|nr:hypothetical protein F5Y13DRAFT_205169 [Hypoxylon sp. FL1857]